MTEMIEVILRVLMFVCGFAVAAWGAWEIHPPAAKIIMGALGISLALWKTPVFRE